MKRHSNILRILLFPFSVIYGFVVYIRNRLFDLKILPGTSFDIPVICIGNITAGGTGKTPMVEYIICLLKEKYKILYISRGYKRKTKGIIRASQNSTVNDIGDEAVQVKQKFSEIEVIVAENRVEGIRNSMINNPDYQPDVVILDDAFQNRYVKAGLSLLLFDYHRSAHKDLILPAGRLRESFSERKRADIMIITKSPANMEVSEKDKFNRIYQTQNNLETFFSGLEYQQLIKVFKSGDNNNYIQSIELQNLGIILITGIANSFPIEEYLLGFSSNIKHYKFPDHYNFKKADIIEIRNEYFKINSKKKIIVTTEKDAARLRSNEYSEEITDLPIYYLPVEVTFYDKREEFNKQILDYVESA